MSANTLNFRAVAAVSIQSPPHMVSFQSQHFQDIFAFFSLLNCPERSGLSVCPAVKTWMNFLIQVIGLLQDLDVGNKNFALDHLQAQE